MGWPRYASLLAGCLLVACGGTKGAPEPTADGGADARIDAHVRADAGDASHHETPDVYVPNRAPGDRTPLSAACDAVDPTRCLLPWPSNTFTLVDKSTATGLRVDVSPAGIARDDDAGAINRADGFSRVTPILTAFNGLIDIASLGDTTTGAVRVIVEQPGPSFGQVVPLRFDLATDTLVSPPQSMIIAYTRVPLAPATDYTVVVMDTVTAGGKALTPDRLAKVALGQVPAATAAEGALYAYDAPARQAMAAAGLSTDHAIRVWDFTTRSLGDPTSDLQTMRSAELSAFSSADGGVAFNDAGPEAGAPISPEAGLPSGVGFLIDSVSPTTNGTVALVVDGYVTGLPSYLTTGGVLSRNDAGAPSVTGTHSAPFRVAVPVGTGDYPIVMYGHGLGGNYDDPTFDEEITAGGAAKVGIVFTGFTGSTIVQTFGEAARQIIGTDIATSGLVQSLADGAVVQAALAARLGDLLSAPTLGGVPNPVAGRRPDTTNPVWAGGSLGGTLGFVYQALEPKIVAAVLNVPGAGWTHFVPYSILFKIEEAILHANYATPIDVFLGVATTQIEWDRVDGAVWYDAVGTGQHAVLLEQESIGDPVLPNIGDERVATSSHAIQVGTVLVPIDTLSNAQQAVGQNGITQFKVPADVTDPYDIHGFAANGTPAGVAAQQQIQSFIESVWAGAPSIAVPPECESNTPLGSCNFYGDAGPDGG